MMEQTELSRKERVRALIFQLVDQEKPASMYYLGWLIKQRCTPRQVSDVESVLKSIPDDEVDAWLHGIVLSTGHYEYDHTAKCPILKVSNPR